MMINLALVATAAYGALALASAVALVARHASGERLDDHSAPQVSVVVAARNEEQTLAGCLRSLVHQDYPPDRLEILIVDDYSEDATVDVAAEFAGRYSRVRLLTLSDSGAAPGKASALACGIDRSEAPIVITTDADCTPPSRWVRSMVSRLQNDGLAVLGGPTRLRGDTLFSRIQGMDWMLGFGLAGAMSDLGRPITAMGNNMAFRRAEYETVGGYRSFAESPTEDYEIFRALGRTGTARLVLDPDLLNLTAPVATLGEAMAQRRRWARGGLRTSPAGHLLYALLWSAHLLPLAALAFSAPVALASIGLKVAADVLVLAAAARRTQSDVPWGVLPAFEVFLFAYISLMPFSLAMSRKHVWKGRRLTDQRGASPAS